MKPTTAISIAILAVTGVLIFFAVRRGQALADAINPFRNDNVAAQGFDDLLTLGSRSTNRAAGGFSLGSFVFDLFNPKFDPNAPVADIRLKTVTEDDLRFVGPPRPAAG